ncbi:hypothetical protein HQ531_06075 [bacterium]|nr:hypothetical protein [bacterium]
MNIDIPGRSEQAQNARDEWKKRFTCPENLNHVILVDDVVVLITRKIEKMFFSLAT